MNCHTKLSHSDSFLLARPSHQPHYEAIQNHPSDPPPPPGSRKKGGRGAPMVWGQKEKIFYLRILRLLFGKSTRALCGTTWEMHLAYCYWEILKLARLSERCEGGYGGEVEGWEVLQRIPGKKKTTISTRSRQWWRRRRRRWRRGSQAGRQAITYSCQVKHTPPVVSPCEWQPPHTNHLTKQGDAAAAARCTC